MRSFLALLILDMRPEEAARLGATIALSVGAHIAAAFVLLLLPAAALLSDPEPVELAVIETLPEPIEEIIEPEPEPEPAPEPEPIVEPVVQPVVERRPDPRPERVVAPDEPPPPDAPPPPPAEETIEDFSGMTLTNDSGDPAWASNVGSGAPMEGPVGRPNAQVTGRNRRGQPDGVVGGTGEGEGPAIVSAGNLSRQPGPPSDRLRSLLERNYPREAQQLGIEGTADVRVQVEADGSVRVLSVSRESHEGFGAACRQTIRQGGRWSPPLDRQGQPVATITAFRCTFTVRF